MKSFIKVLQDLALLVLRLVIGGLLMFHGWQRLQVTGIGQQMEVLTAAGIPEPGIMAWAVIAFEFIGGALLIFGAATPIVGLALAVMQGMVVGMSRWDNGLLVHAGGFEYNLVLGAVGLVFLTLGSGRAGIDALFIRPDDDDGSLIGEDEPRESRRDKKTHREHTANSQENLSA